MSNVVIMSEDDYNTLKKAEEIQRALFNGMELVKKAKNELDKTIVICENHMAKEGIEDTFKLIIDNVDNIDNFEFIAITEMEKIRCSKYKKILVTRTAWSVLYDTHKDDYARDILEPLEAAGATVAVIGL